MPHVVTLDTVHGVISGFARVEDLEIEGEDSGYIRGVVMEVSDDTITVRLRGSFFTTNGLAYFHEGQQLLAA